MADAKVNEIPAVEAPPMSEALRDELSRLTSTDRSAVIM